jgi:hypothetical protein
VENMTTVVDDLLECVTIEICMEKPNVSCIYRAPGSILKYSKIGWETCLQYHYKRICLNAGIIIIIKTF